MSYILDALKKADAERERAAVPGLHTEATPLADDALPKTLSVTTLAVGVAALALAALGVMGWQLWQHAAPPAPAPAPVPAQPSSPPPMMMTPPIQPPAQMPAPAPTLPASQPMSAPPQAQPSPPLATDSVKQSPPPQPAPAEAVSPLQTSLPPPPDTLKCERPAGWAGLGHSSTGITGAAQGLTWRRRRPGRCARGPGRWCSCRPGCRRG